MKKYWIDGLTILVTGASSGIGRELCKLFLIKHNCKVIGIGRSEEKFQKFIVELGDKKEKFEYICMDVSIEENWMDLRKKLDGTNIDVLINNAGILPPFESFSHLISRIKDGDRDKIINLDLHKNIGNIIDTNFLASVYSIGYFMDMIEKSNSPAIINVSSSAGLCALPGISIYSASKSALKNYTESLMCEKEYYVGLICPGFTLTDIFRNQTRNTGGKLINKFASTLEKMTKKIYIGILKKRKLGVYGMDAKFMSRTYRMCPKNSLKFLTKVLKKSNMDLFKDVFEE